MIFRTSFWNQVQSLCPFLGWWLAVYVTPPFNFKIPQKLDSGISVWAVEPSLNWTFLCSILCFLDRKSKPRQYHPGKGTHSSGLNPEVRLLESESWLCHWLAVWPRASPSIILGLSFLLWKRESWIDTPPGVAVRIKWDNAPLARCLARRERSGSDGCCYSCLLLTLFQPPFHSHPQLLCRLLPRPPWNRPSSYMACLPSLSSCVDPDCEHVQRLPDSHPGVRGGQLELLPQWHRRQQPPPPALGWAGGLLPHLPAAHHCRTWVCPRPTGTLLFSSGPFSILQTSVA